MALQPPTVEELKQAARANHFELSDKEAATFEAMLPGMFTFLERIDSATVEPQPSVAKYRDRDPGARPAREKDPLNAIVRRCHIKGAPSGKLAGKRIGLKDSVCAAGIPISAGSRVLEGYVPDIDATIVSRMLDAGGEIVAILNMDDFALSGDGTTSAYGPTLNPHNRAYCSGGSSAGSGAALYYDDIDITIGTDQGGSIRIPASWCGVVGIKPTYGLVPYTGVLSIDPSLDHVGPMARTVSDVSLALEVIAGKDPLDPRQGEHRSEDYVRELSRNVSGLRVGILREGFAHPGAQPDVDAAVRDAAAKLGKLGVHVEEVSMPAHREAFGLLWGIVAEGMCDLAHTNLAGTHFQGLYNASLADRFGEVAPSRTKDVASTVKLILLLGTYLRSKYHGRIYAKAQNQRRALRAEYDELLANHDALVMPTTPMKAPRQDERAPYSMLANTAPFDVTGHPGLSIPCAMRDGLPVGMMLIGRHFSESTLLRLGYAFEQSADWRKA